MSTIAYILLFFSMISFAEFQAFEALLCLPDAMYALAFQIFDRNGNGSITCGMIDLISKRYIVM